MKKHVWLCVLGLASVATVQAASFDCSKAKTAVERQICADAGLSLADETLDAIYRNKLNKTEDSDALIAAQRAWLKERNRCEDEACIQSAYEKRIEALTGGPRPQHILYPPLVPIEVPETGEIPELERPYVIEKGQGVEVCEAYRKNLNSYRPKVPFTCGRPVNKAIAGFERQPGWRRPFGGRAPTGEKDYTYYDQMSKLLWPRDVNPAIYHTVTEWPNWQGTPEQLMKAKEKFEYDRETLFMVHPPYITKLDIDNDGTPEPVYLEQPCGSVFGARIAALTPDWKGIDRKKTEKLMPHPPFARNGRSVFRSMFPNEIFTQEERERGYTAIEDAWHDLYYDVFLYRGAAYFDQWWGMHPDFKGKTDMVAGRLRVFQSTTDDTKEVCVYKFAH
ncbi:MAG: lysozyme inhibitor LprI family protein [Candidatus Zixiibacteriota bacterium]